MALKKNKQKKNIARRLLIYENELQSLTVSQTLGKESYWRTGVA